MAECKSIEIQSIEYEPVSLNENTEVKIPVQTIDEFDINGEPSYTNSGECESDEQYLEDYDRLSALYRQHPTDTFVHTVLRIYASDEEKLDSIRLLFFSALRENDDFPYNINSELKRRVSTRRGDPVCAKLAKDIHTLVSVLEGEDYSCLREMISNTKPRLNSQVLTNQTQARQSMNDVAVLKDAVSLLQADVLLLKQKVTTNEQLHTEKLSVMSQTVNSIKGDIQACNDSVHTYVSSLLKKIDEIDPIVQLLESRLSDIERKVTELDDFLSTPGTVVVTKCDVLERPTVPDRDKVEVDDNCALNNDGSISDNISTSHDSQLSVANQHNTLITFNVDSSELESPLRFGNVDVPQKRYHGNAGASASEIADFLLGFVNDDVCHNEPFVASKTSDVIYNDRDGDEDYSSRQSSATGVRSTGINPIPVRMVPRKSLRNDGYSSGRHRTKRYFVGGFSNTISTDKLSTFITNRGPKVTMIRKFTSRKRPNKAILRINIEANEYADLVMEDGFWPRDIVCRRWLSRGSLRKRDTGVQGSSQYEYPSRPTNRFQHVNRFESLYDNVD